MMELEILNRGRGRKRDESARKAILRAAYELIAEHGYRALTFEGVAAKSGCGKTTIYRWWPTKAALSTDSLLAELAPVASFERTGSAVQDLRLCLHLMAETLSGTNGQVMACILGGAREDPETAAVYKEKIMGPRRDIGRECLRIGVMTGEIRSDVDLDVALDALFLPLFVRLMYGTGGVDAVWVDKLADTVLHGIAARTEETHAASEPRPHLPTN